MAAALNSHSARAGTMPPLPLLRTVPPDRWQPCPRVPHVGVVLLNVHLITGGFAFTAVSIPMVLICCHSHRSDDDRASKPTAATSFGEITVAGPPSDAWLRVRLISDDGVLGAPIAAIPF